MFEGLTAVAVDAAQEGAAYAALHAVVGAGAAGRNKRSARDRHVPNMTGAVLSGHRKCLKRTSENIDIVRVLSFSSVNYLLTDVSWGARDAPVDIAASVSLGKFSSEITFDPGSGIEWTIGVSPMGGGLSGGVSVRFDDTLVP